MRNFLIVVISAVLFCYPQLEAQVGQAEISGTIMDETGAVLPGAAVTATLVTTGFTRTIVSNDQGQYRLNNLPVGTYTFRVEMPGFNVMILEGYKLNVGQSVVQDFRMTVETVAETVNVRAEAPLIQTSKSDLAGVIDDNQVENLPILGRNWLGFAALAPGVKSSGAEGDRDTAPTAGIGVGRQDKVILDGADLNNRSTASEVDMRLSKEVIGEFEVKTNQFDAQWGQSGTSITTAISKSGTDQFHGNVYYFFRDDALNANDFLTGTKEPFRNEQYGGTIGGPILKEKTHFFFNFERQEQPRTVTSNTGIPSIDIPVDNSQERNLWFVRVDHAINDNHRLSGRFNRATRFEPHSGTGGNTAPIASLDFDWTFNRYNVALNSVFGSKWVNQLTVNRQDTNRLFGKRPGSGIRHEFPSVSLGGNRGGGFENPDFTSIRDDMSVFFGSHNIKFGGYYEEAKLTGFFLFGVNGFFSYDEDPPNLDTCCASENQAEWDTSQFPIPTSFFQVLGDPSIDSPNEILGLYIQDDWKVHPRLTLNLGLRYDVEFGSLANNLDGALLQTPFSNDTDNFQPRLGFAYSLTDDRKSVLRGGVGKFYSQAFLNVTFFVERTNRIRQLNVSILNNDNDPNFGDDPLGGLTFDDFVDRIGNPEFPLDIAVFGDDARQPSMWNYTIGFAHSITPDLSVSADYVHQRSNDQLRSADTNLFCCLPDGNAFPVVSGDFPELGGLVEGRGRPDPRFNSIRTFSNDGKARYHGLQVAMNKRYSNRYQFGLTYLLSKNEDNFNDVFDLPSNTFDLEGEFSRSQSDQRHRFTANWITGLPYGFNVSGIVFAGSGFALPANTGNLDIFGTRPEPRGRAQRPTCGLDPRFDAACQLLGVPDGTRIPRNPFRSDSIFRIDFRVAKVFRFGEDVSVEPTFEVFNLFNRENFDPSSYNTNLNSTGFTNPGRSANLSFLPRNIQLGVKFSF